MPEHEEDPGGSDPEPAPADPEKLRPKPEDFEYYVERPLKSPHSWGDMDERHWSKARGDRNEEVFEYYRSRSHAPGVEEGGAVRNQYCMKCDGVIPLSYFQMRPADDAVQHCPHCGVELDRRIHRMFNWVEIDQPHDGDLKALLPFFLGGAVLVALLLWLIF